MSQTIIKDFKATGVGNIIIKELSEENKQRLARGENLIDVKLDMQVKELVINDEI